jgi:hypothetical protein
MGNIATHAFRKKIPLPLVKTVDILADATHPAMAKFKIVLSLQAVKMEDSRPFGLFVALINNERVLKYMKKNPRAMRYLISNKVTPGADKYMIKKYIGMEDFITDGKIKHIINKREGTGVVVRDVPIDIDIYPSEDQNLWIFCVAYEMDNENGSAKIVGTGGNKKFSIGEPIVEPIMVNGSPPVTTHLYLLNEDDEKYGRKGDAWVGPVHRVGKRYYPGQFRSHDLPRLRRTKVSNQKIKDLRLLQTIEDLDLDNFVVNMRNINKTNFKNYERVKELLGKKYFSRLRYSRSSTGDFKLFFSMDYDAFIDDNCKFAGLFTNKASLKSCYAINEIVVFRSRVNRGSEGSALVDDIVVEKDNMFQEPPRMIGSLKKGNVGLLDVDNNKFLNFLISDPSMRKEDINKFQYTVHFEFEDRSAHVLKKIVQRLRKDFAEFESFMSKFEGLGKKNFDVEEYLRVNAKVIKTDDSWLKLMNEFLASIWFIFGSAGFGGQSPILWKKNLTTMVNPMSATEKTLGEFTETIKDYISDLTRLVEASAVGRSSKKFSARSSISKGNNLIRRIKFVHTPRVVTKSAENGIGFDYLGIGRYVKEGRVGLPQMSYDACNQRLGIELNKYQVANPNSTSVNKYGFLSPQKIHTPYEIQDTSADHLELADGLVILESRKNPSIHQFTANGPVGEDSIKIAAMTSIMGSAGIIIEPLLTPLSDFVESRKAPAEEQNEVPASDYFDPTTFPISNQYIENQVSGSDEATFARMQAMQRKVKALESDLAERLTDGVARNFVPPRVRRTNYIRGSLALTRLNEDRNAFEDLNSFERDINYNSIVRLQVLEGYRDDDVRRPRWGTLTQTRFNELKADGSTVICRLKRCPSVTYPGSSYRLGRFNYLFILGDEPDSQDEVIKTSYRKRYDYYLRRLRRLNTSWTTNINRAAANYGAEYYTPSTMIFDAKWPVRKAIGLKKSKKSRRKALRLARGRPQVSTRRRTTRRGTTRTRRGRY